VLGVYVMQATHTENEAQPMTDMPWPFTPGPVRRCPLTAIDGMGARSGVSALSASATAWPEVPSAGRNRQRSPYASRRPAVRTP
jgi:hypothetical protein